MKKVLSLFILLFFVFTLVGCSSINGIKGDFIDAGYTYDEEDNQNIQDLMTEFEEKNITVTPHLFKKNLNLAIVLEFKSTKEMNEQIDESETLKGLLKDIQKSDFVRGNCLLIPIGINAGEMIDIFQGRFENKKV